LANTAEFSRAQRQRKTVEALFAELKNDRAAPLALTTVLTHILKAFLNDAKKAKRDLGRYSFRQSWLVNVNLDAVLF
jgi:hypothetical protein